MRKKSLSVGCSRQNEACSLSVPGRLLAVPSMALMKLISPALRIYQAYSEDKVSTLPDLQPVLEQPRGLVMGCWRQIIAPLTCQVKHPQQRVAVPPN